MMAPLQQARDFLSRVVDWSEGYVNIHSFVQKPGYNRRFMQGSAVQSVDAAIEQMIYMAGKPEHQDVYFCTSSQAACEEKQFGQRIIRVAVRNRDQAMRCKALFLDIDVGKEGGYETGADAVAGLKKFITDTKLPIPTAIIASGTGGFHVYWIMEQSLSVDDWQPLADAMVSAGKASGLLFDSQCTVDAVRILRIPQTRNFKTDPPTPVALKSLQQKDIPNGDLVAALLPFIQAGFPSAPFAPKNPIQEGDEFSAGIQTGAAPREISEVAVHCAWIRDTLADGGAQNDNPRWFLSLRTALFCNDANQVGHDLSRGHHGYHPDETQQELERLRKERERNPRIGFPSCQAISQAGAPQCATCPLLAEGKSPLSAVKVLGHSVGTGTTLPSKVVNPYLPDGYRIGVNGWIVQDITDDTGKVTTDIFLRAAISNPQIVILPNGSRALQFTNTYGGGRKQKVTIPSASLNSKDTLGRELAAAMIYVRVTDKVIGFMNSFLEKLRDSKEGVSDGIPYGWTFSGEDDEVYEGFAYAGRRWGLDGEETAPLANAAIYSLYRPSGASAHWTEAAKLITNQKRPALDALLASAFAAPLVYLAGLDGICIGGVSAASGVGKTTTLNIAAAVWGDPIKSKQGLGDTGNSVFSKAGQIRNLPIYYDELKTMEDTKSFINMMFQLTSGKEKSRANRNGEVRDQKGFSTMLVYATNESLYEPVMRHTTGTDAGHLRMFEFNVEATREDQRNPMLATLAGKLRTNFGHAGIEYAQHLGTHYKSTMDQVLAVQAKWAQLVDALPEERFWVGACATLIVGANIANKIGLTEFDEVALRKFLHAEFMKKRVHRAETPNDFSRPEAVAAILGEFLAEKQFEYTVVTNQVLLTRGRPHPGTIKVEGEGSARLNRLKMVQVQYGRENGVLRFSDMAFGEWLKVKGYPKGSITTALKNSFGATAVFARLASGTQYSDPVTRPLWQLSIPGSGLEGMVEYDIEEGSNEEVSSSSAVTADA